jgi:two-component system, NtrC family, nitrogen regulation sensor histidine kinase NtrY
MTSGSFRLNVVIRVLLLTALISLLLYSIYVAGWIITPVIILLTVGVSVTELVFYVEKTNREFTDFLLSVKSADFSKYNTSDKRGKSFSEFKEALNIIIDEFQAARIDREAHYTFLQKIMEHLNTAIISIDSTGEVKVINEAAKQLLHNPYLVNINSLQQSNLPLFNYLASLQPGRNPIFEIEVKGERLKLSARYTAFKIQGIEHKLISIQNIKPEIEATEIETWEQQLHVLTHEIMNSMTPISSLSSTLKKKMEVVVNDLAFNEEVADDLSKGLQVIENRSNGLANFVNHYKSLITLPVPSFKPVQAKDLLDSIHTLTSRQLQEKGIRLLIANKSPITISIDADLIQQVLINLVNNASDALSGTNEPVIKLSAELANGKPVITVADNGEGISNEVMNKIFIPFFTTRTKGTGIGLSLSKQIMRLHNGSISVKSTEGQGTVFLLEFPGQL